MRARHSPRQPCFIALLLSLSILQPLSASSSFPRRGISASSQNKASNYRADLRKLPPAVACCLPSFADFISIVSRTINTVCTMCCLMEATTVTSRYLVLSNTNFCAVSKQETCEPPHFVDWAVWEHGCVHERNVCIDQVSGTLAGLTCLFASANA